MESITLDLKAAPEVLRVIRAVDPSYRKHKAILRVCDSVTLSGTYWDGGSRSCIPAQWLIRYYAAVNLSTGRSKGAPQYQFGGPRNAPRVSIPEGLAIVQTGIFCGKTATAFIYLNPANAAKLIGGIPAGCIYRRAHAK